MNRDTLFAKPAVDLVDFKFDEHVVDVFPDMIRRSVPGYENLLGYMGLFAQKYVTADSRCYDLGCSRGATSLSLRSRAPDSATIVAVDNSPAMMKQCEQVLVTEPGLAAVELRCEDIQATGINNASLAVMNFTLQFIPVEQRDALIAKIYAGLNPGGALVISEKIIAEHDAEDAYLHDLHTEFKRANGYSDLEISQKRAAIENVLVREKISAHRQRLEAAGFTSVVVWFQCLNFCSFVAVKPC